MPRSLADGHVKLTLLITKPANPAAPTVAELTAGIDASCRILASDFKWSATNSDTISEKALCTEGNATVPGASNFEASITPFRYFTSEGAADSTEDAVMQALLTKGTELWGYARKTSKKSTEAWAAADEVYLGLHVLTDNPQSSDMTGYIKYLVPLLVQEGYPFIEVAAA